MQTTVQDAGRWGWQSLGVPVAGAMDWYSYRLANQLVGNGPDAAAMEVSFIGPELEFERAVTVAVAGAPFSILVDDEPLDMHRAHEIEEGGRVRFGARRGGARAYIAVRGGIAVPATLGSRSTHLLSAMGGFEGRALRAGDRLPIGVAVPGRRESAAVSAAPLEMPTGGARLRVLAGPHGEDCQPGALERLVGSRYHVGPQSDRMGYRLEGPDLASGVGDLISDATCAGAIQVPPSGQPIILMADRQTTGGYPIVAAVITADLPIAGQLSPGDWIEFECCDRQTALDALRVRQASLAQ